MRVLPLTLALLLAAGCGKGDVPPAPSPPTAPDRGEAEENLEQPTRPTAAFAPAQAGGCARTYRLVRDTCVHRLYKASNEAALELALDAYRRGVAPPMVGPIAPTAQAELRSTTRVGPGSLTRNSSARADGGSSEGQRLAELDAMLALARAKLQKRDEESKAKKVENAPRAARTSSQGDAGERDGLDRFAAGMGSASSPSGAAAAGDDPAAARMGELSRLASQLSGEQLQALTAELGKSGLAPGALEAILSEAREGTQPH